MYIVNFKSILFAHRLFLLLALMTANFSHAETTKLPHAHGVHGMVMFGQDSLYVSHLPLYAHPHDWQVIARVAINDAAISAATKTHLKAKSLITIEPEKFDLMRLNPANKENPIRTFKANLYIGHFERGGKLWKKDVDIKVVEIKEFRKLDPQSAKPSQAEYYVLGDKQQTYLIHRIFGRPDFDHIVQVKNRKNKTNWQQITTSFVNTSENRIQANNNFTHFLKQHGWRDIHEVYYETSDLQ
jgi:hypothetical protein